MIWHPHTETPSLQTAGLHSYLIALIDSEGKRFLAPDLYTWHADQMAFISDSDDKPLPETRSEYWWAAECDVLSRVDAVLVRMDPRQAEMRLCLANLTGASAAVLLRLKHFVGSPADEAMAIAMTALEKAVDEARRVAGWSKEI